MPVRSIDCLKQLGGPASTLTKPLAVCCWYDSVGAGQALHTPPMTVLHCLGAVAVPLGQEFLWCSITCSPAQARLWPCVAFWSMQSSCTGSSETRHRSSIWKVQAQIVVAWCLSQGGTAMEALASQTKASAAETADVCNMQHAS